MEDFDVARADRIAKDRRFKIGGEVLTYRASVRPEAMVAWSSVTADTADDKALETIDGVVREFVLPDSWEKWQALRQVEGDEAINLADLMAVVTWLVEAQTDRPTDPSSASVDGSATVRTGTSSTDASPSPVAQTPQVSTFGAS